MSFTDDFKRGANPYRDQLIECLLTLKDFAINPIDSMAKLPKWDWPTILIFYSSLAAVSGIIRGILDKKIMAIIAGFIVMPISANIGAIILAGFLYYVFIYFYKREVNFQLLFTVVVFSAIPSFAMNTFAGYLEWLSPIGVAAASMLLVVGLHIHTQLDKRSAIRLVGSLYLIFAIFWLIQYISFHSETVQFKSRATPESLEKLREEFGQ